MRKARSPSKRAGRQAEPDDRALLDADAARGRALKLLSRREHSAAELSLKLQRRGAETDVAQQAVAAMQDAGWQSDARYAEMLVRNRIAQGYGPLRIRADLAAARIPETATKAALAAAEADWPALCAALRRRRFRAAPGNAAEWQKQYRYLASHGFPGDAVRAALKAAGARGGDDEDFSSGPEEEGWD
ncbi:MAG: regulatory protein RecX [Solimonas sp.]